jgi:ABC-type branched-subunit amino acid transport system substrate-binding protein
VGQTNAQGGIDGKWQINLISKDDGSDVAKASAAVTQLIQQDKVDFILQPWVDFIAPVARGIEEKAGTPGVLSYHPAKNDTQTYHWTFSNAQGAEDNADALVKVFAQKGWKTVVGVGDVLTIQQETLDFCAEKAPSHRLQDRGRVQERQRRCPGPHDHGTAGRRDDEGAQGRRPHHPGHRRPDARSGHPSLRAGDQEC